MCIYTYVYVFICTYTCIYMYISARLYESFNTKSIEGLAPWRCHFETGTTVVQNISTHQGGLVEMKNPTRLSNKTSTA